MIEMFQIDLEDSILTSFYVRGDNLLQLKQRVSINYLNGIVLEGVVIFTESKSVTGNKVTIHFDNYKVDDFIFNYELLG